MPKLYGLNWRYRGLPAHYGITVTMDVAPLRVVCFGDSQTANNRDVSTADRVWNVSMGWFPWLQQRTDQSMDWVGNFGYPGAQADTVSTHIPEVLALQPNIVFMEDGGNDIAVGTPTSVLKPKLLAQITAFTSLGIAVVWVLFPPSRAATPTQIAGHNEMSAWLISLVIPRFSVLDLREALADATGLIAAAYTNDGTHPNAAGGFRGGIAAYQALGSSIPRVNRLPMGSAAQEPANIIDNPLMTGTGGNKTSYFTGSVPTGWSVTDQGSGASVACSIVAASAWDLDQNPWLQVAVSNSGTAGIRISSLDAAATKWAVGDGFQYHAIGQIEVDPGIAGAFIQPFLRQENASAVNIQRAYDMFISNTPQVWPGENPLLPHRRWVFQTPPMQIQPGVAQLKAGVDVNVTGTLRLRRCTARRYRNPLNDLLT